MLRHITTPWAHNLQVNCTPMFFQTRTRALIAVILVVSGITVAALLGLANRLASAPGLPNAPIYGLVEGDGTAGKWNLVFSDEFDRELDVSKWSTCFHFAEVVNGRLTCALHADESIFVNIPENVLIENGILRLQAQAKPVEAFQRVYPYSSGMVSTHNTYSFQYGYIEMRARLPKGAGLWPVFWLMPATKQWPPEIDILEVLGKDPGVVYQSVHYADPNGRDAWITQAYTSTVDLTAGFHDYGLLWTPDTLVWYVDGVPTNTLNQRVPQEQMYVLLTHAVGSVGSWPGPPNAKTIFPNYLEIDHVRIYQSKK